MEYHEKDPENENNKTEVFFRTFSKKFIEWRSEPDFTNSPSIRCLFPLENNPEYESEYLSQLRKINHLVGYFNNDHYLDDWKPLNQEK